MARAIATLILLPICFDLFASWLGIPLPGSIVGFAVLLIWCASYRKPSSELKSASHALVRFIPVLLVPAAVGIMQYWSLLKEEAIPLAAGLFLGTFAAITVTAILFRFLISYSSRSTEPKPVVESQNNLMSVWN